MANKFRNLVFEGGGVKGVAYGGALQALQQMDILQHIKRVAGTSAGAITAALLAVGYTPGELTDILKHTDYNKFKDADWGVFRNFDRLLEKYGWNKGKSFKKWIAKLIRAKTGSADTTFAELDEMARDDDSNFLKLWVVGTDLSEQKYQIFSTETTPNTRLQDAVRISMSIPFFFQCVRNIEKDVLVDGGVTYNYPLNIFDWKRYVDRDDNAETVEYQDHPEYVFNHETLGFRLDTKDEMKYEARDWGNVPRDIDNIVDFSMAIMTFMYESANKAHLHKNDWNRTVFIDSLGVKTTDFDITPEEVEALIDSGRKGVQEHFHWRNGENGMDRP